MTDIPFKQWQTDISKFNVKTRIKFKLLQGANERGELGLSDLKLYFSPCIWYG